MLAPSRSLEAGVPRTALLGFLSPHSLLSLCGTTGDRAAPGHCGLPDSRSFSALPRSPAATGRDPEEHLLPA